MVIVQANFELQSLLQPITCMLYFDQKEMSFHGKIFTFLINLKHVVVFHTLRMASHCRALGGGGGDRTAPTTCCEACRDRAPPIGSDHAELKGRSLTMMGGWEQSTLLPQAGTRATSNHRPASGTRGN